MECLAIEGDIDGSGGIEVIFKNNFGLEKWHVWSLVENSSGLETCDGIYNERKAKTKRFDEIEEEKDIRKCRDLPRCNRNCRSTSLWIKEKQTDSDREGREI